MGNVGAPLPRDRNGTHWYSYHLAWGRWLRLRVQRQEYEVAFPSKLTMRSPLIVICSARLLGQTSLTICPSSGAHREVNS
jgi:hypothetical protein